MLILAPTRELASQIGESFRVYGRGLTLRSTVVYGGVNQHPQVTALRQGIDVLVATPGRLLDLMNQGFIDLGAVEIFVLDEADRMLDMGFIPDVRRITAKLPARAADPAVFRHDSRLDRGRWPTRYCGIRCGFRWRR